MSAPRSISALEERQNKASPSLGDASELRRSPPPLGPRSPPHHACSRPPLHSASLSLEAQNRIQASSWTLPPPWPRGILMQKWSPFALHWQTGRRKDMGSIILSIKRTVVSGALYDVMNLSSWHLPISQLQPPTHSRWLLQLAWSAAFVLVSVLGASVKPPSFSSTPKHRE